MSTAALRNEVTQEEVTGHLVIQSAHFVTVYLLELGHATAIAFAVLGATIMLWAVAGARLSRVAPSWASRAR